MRIARALMLAGGGALVCLAARVAEGQANEREDVRRREEYARETLTYPYEQVPADILARYAALRMERARQAQMTNALIGNAWTPIGPAGLMPLNGYYNSLAQLDAGRISQIAIDPQNRDTWYVATAGGGIWKTTDAGASWSPRTDDQCSMNMGAVAVDPKNPNIVYAGTGELNTWSFGCGVLRSVDGGSDWTTYTSGIHQVANAGGMRQALGVIYVDSVTAGSTSGTTLLLGGGFGIYRSTNSGRTWSSVMLTRRTDNIVAHPGNPDILYAGIGEGNTNAYAGVWISIDKGLTWLQLDWPPGVTPTSVYRVGLATSPAAPDKLWMVFAGYDDRLIGGWVWRLSTNEYAEFNATSVYGMGDRGDFGEQATYDLLFAVDPSDERRIFLGGVRMYRSEDGGISWRQIAGDIHVDWHAIAFDPVDSRRIVAGSDGGVYVSLDGGDSWTSRNYGLAITQYYPGISLHPTDPTKVFGGSQDNGSHRSYGMPMWDGVGSGDGGYTAVNYSNPGVFWTTCQWLPGACIYRYDPSSGYSARTSGISPSDRAQFIPPLVIDPVTPTTLYFGTMVLYQTTDEGASGWSAISPDLTNGSGRISAIAVAPSNPSYIYVGTSDGLVRVTVNGGSTWEAAGTGLPNRYVSDVWVDPLDPEHAVAVHTGFGAPHVYQTTDAGATWTSASGNLPDVPVRAIVYVPTEDLFIIGTDLGVYQSADGGATWSAGPPGMPLVLVMDLAYSEANAMVVAATHGRGMFKLAVTPASAVLRGDVDRDGSVGAFDAVLIQRALIGRDLGSDDTGEPYVAMPRGDANCNGTLEAVDALITLRSAVGLPVGAACVNSTAVRGRR